MPVDIVMPRLSDTMTEGTVARWLKKPGDTVKRGEPIAEIETDKALMQFESFDEGVLGEIAVADGQSAPLGERIAVLYRDGEKPGPAKPTDGPAAAGANKPTKDAAPARATPPAPPAHPVSPPDTPGREPKGGNGPRPGSGGVELAAAFRPKASPLARRIAAEKGVDLARIEGTGPGGRILRADVEEARPQTAAFKPFSRMEGVIARRMVESKTQVPHFYMTVSIDMDAAIKFRADSKQYAEFSINDLFVKAVALTLRDHPQANASYREGGYQLNAEINVGVAVALPRGLVVPVIRNADKLALPEIAREAKRLAEKARTRGLEPADYEGGTFTISNVGMFGDIEEFSAIVNPPQAAILAIGRALQEPVVRDGQIVVGSRCRVTLSCDHRVLYGAEAAELLRDLKALVEAPLGLVWS